MNHTGPPKKVSFTPNDDKMYEISIRIVIDKGCVDHSSKVYKFSHFNPFATPYALLTCTNEERKLWHERFVHLNYKYISDLHEKNTVEGFPNIKFSKKVCQSCILGKNLEHKYERVSHERTSTPLEIIHSEIAGPLPHMSMGQEKYVLNFIDDFSRYCWVYFLKLNYEVFDDFKFFKALVENQSGRRLKILIYNNGGEYVNF